VYDKTVRRRRAVLGLLVAFSLILLTAYFGESNGGGLHAIQRGVVTVVSPIQDVASRALSPARDFVNWVGDTLHAKGKLSSVQTENRALIVKLRRYETDYHRALAQGNIKTVITNDGLRATDPVHANVIDASSNVFNAFVNIDKGSSDGIVLNQPVLGGDDRNAAMIGVISNVWATGAQVRLITNTKSSVDAEDPAANVRGDLQPLVGDPNAMTLNNTPGNNGVTKGDIIATSGTCSSNSRLDAHEPEGIPLGIVSSVSNPGANPTIHVKPLVDLSRVFDVTVLRRIIDDNRNTSPSCP
jgi:rod shape-determining protein MreC